MYTVCIICKDSLSTIPPRSLYEGRVGSLFCGHVFHVSCINAWWNQKRRDYVQFMNPRLQPAVRLIYQCPTCRQGGPNPQILELFLDFDESEVRSVAAAADQNPSGNTAQVQQDREELQSLIDAANGLRLERDGRQEGGQ